MKSISRLRSSVIAVSLSLVASGLVASSAGSVVSAAPGDDLFISEYIEGGSFNKAIEIYNGTGAPVDLAAGGYSLELYSNGSATVSQSTSLSGTIADGDVYVLAHPSASAAVLAQADITSGSVINFNGDDAVVLRKGGAVLDAFGQVGFDPGSQWVGGGQNDTLLRNADICEGDTDETDAFDASVEWTILPQDTFDDLGMHTADCGGSSEPVLLINEVDADTPGTDVAEFIELYDGGAGSTDLTGTSIVLYNGSDDQSYEAFDLDGFSTNTDGYFVLCGDAANVANCDLDVEPNSNLVQNGADAVALYTGDAINFPNDTPITLDGLLDAIVYDTNDSDDAALLVLLNPGQPQINEDGAGAKDTDSSQRCPDGSGGALNTDTYAQFVPTPGVSNLCEIVVPPLSCTSDDALTLIHAIQGNGATSPIVGSDVVVEAVVTGIFPGLLGFTVQEEAADSDSDPSTSDGIFVFSFDVPADLEVGDQVRVQGAVTEYETSSGASSLTEISAAAIVSCGAVTPIAPTDLLLPLTSADAIEQVEGMLVTLSQTLTISEYFNFDRFGEVVVSTDRQLTPTAVVEPGPAAIALAEAQALARITIDDGRTSQNPDPAIHPGNGDEFDLDNLFRGGDTITGVNGIIDERFGLYRVQPTTYGTYAAVNDRTAAPDDVGGDLTVASFNVLNYFTTLDGNGSICGPAGNQGCRGADDAGELDRQRSKIVAAMAAIDADVLGLIEIENNINDDAVNDLVASLNDAVGAGTYAAVDTGAIGDDAIKVAFIYKPASVSLEGAYALLDGSVDPRFLDGKNRPVLAQTFVDNTGGGVFTVAVNHLKSKGSPCDDLGDPDVGDGSGNCNGVRTAAAEALVDWLASDPTASGSDKFLIIGDLNSYDKEAPIDAIIAGADDTAGTTDDYTDLVRAYLGEDAYSYVFDGKIGYLDHALANAALLDDVTGTTVWHINSDEPDLLDYDTSFKRDAQDAIFAPDPYRSSDHDPVIIGLDVCDVIAPTFDQLTVSPEVLSPPNHKYVDVAATVVASDNSGLAPMVRLLSVISNEPDNGQGDGNTVDDIVIVDGFNFKLRAERSGKGDGRVYTITYELEDACGNTAVASVVVTVPKGNNG